MAEEKDAPDCCRGCASWVTRGKECWVYWDLKKECTMHVPEFEIANQQVNEKK